MGDGWGWGWGDGSGEAEPRRHLLGGLRVDLGLQPADLANDARLLRAEAQQLLTVRLALLLRIEASLLGDGALDPAVLLLV